MALGDFDTLNFVANVTERDIDYLILEELQVSHEFREWITARVFEWPLLKAHIGAWHSVADPVLGESDLIFLFEAEDGSTKAILIENKISAGAQPDQGKRYTQRGEKGKEQEIWQEYKSCLIAPRRYLEAQLETYDCYLAYEEVMAHFASQRSKSARCAYRATMMMEAIKQDRRGYKPKVDEKATNFVRNYWDLASQAYPGLGMHPPKPRAAGNTWVGFSPSGLPKSVDFFHQLTAGYFKIFFKQRAADYEAFKFKYQPLEKLIPSLSVDLAGKSVSISVPVPPVDPQDQPFERSRSEVETALITASTLLSEMQKIGFSD
jgi:hypothetical protein